MTRVSLAAAALISAIAPVTMSGQPMFRAGIELVEVDVSVMRGKAPVGGLTARNFVLSDNGVKQQIRTAATDVPLSVTLVLDVSESVDGKRLDALRAAGLRLADSLRPGDRASLVTFSEHIRRPVRLGGSLDDFRSRLATLTAEGRTAIRDATEIALVAGSRERTRALLLLFTDGVDNASWTSQQQLLSAADRGNMVIHAVRFENDAFLDRLTSATGGRTWSARSDDDLDELFTEALAEMRARYVLSYSPSIEGRQGWHEIKVSLVNAKGDVAARRGYFVP